MKPLVLFIFTLFLSSCSGYFNDKTGTQFGNSVDTLVLADGSGYLSTDNYNEITPFLFRDDITGRNWLFFSSDRAGNYDIYFAELYSSGKFSQPVKMTNLINSASNEFSPVVFRAALTAPPTTNYYISFINTSISGNSTNVISWRLDSNFNLAYASGEDGFSFNAKHIGFFYDDSNRVLKGFLIISDGTSNGFIFYKGNNNGNTFAWGNSGTMMDLTNTLHLNKKSLAVNGVFSYITGFAYFIFQNTNNQLSAGNVLSTNTNISFSDISPYASSYNDRDPFIDYGGVLWPVYFSSDRRGKGNYDLYRYNTKTYWTVTH